MMVSQLHQHLQTLKAGKGKVLPGQELHISEAAQPGDGVYQGDVLLALIDEIPSGFVEVDLPADGDAQLAPGNTKGSRHCIDDLTTCVVYLPPGFSRDSSYEGYLGPVLVCHAETRITHPEHGDVIIPSDRIIQCAYQRIYDDELKRARRARD